MAPKLKPPATKRLRHKCDIPLSTSAFKLNLRRYNMGAARVQVAHMVIKAKVRTTTNCSPRHLKRFFKPRLYLTCMASYDMASNIWQALGGGGGGGGATHDR